MSESDDIDAEKEAIREEKREKLKERLENGGAAGTEAEADADAELDSSTPVHVESPDHFQRLVSDHDVVLVDFYADWCGPCKMLEPTVESIAQSTDALVAKVDVDQLQGLAQQSSVRGVPTLVLYEGGQPVERLVGVQDESRLRSVVEQHT